MNGHNDKKRKLCTAQCVLQVYRLSIKQAAAAAAAVEEGSCCCCCSSFFNAAANLTQLLFLLKCCFPSCCCSLFHKDGNLLKLQFPFKFCSKFASATIYFICSIKYILSMVSETVVNVFTFLFLFFSDATSIKG